MKFLRRIAITTFLLGITGCGSILSLKLGGPRVLGGIRADCQIAYEIPFEGGLFSLLDLPFSFLFDFLVFPWTFAYSAEHGERPLETPWTHPHSGPYATGIIEIYLHGVVTQASSPGYRVCAEKEFLGTPPSDWNGLANVKFKVFSSLTDPPLASITALPSGSTGYFLVAGGWEVPWEIIRVECDGFQPLEIPVSSLRSLTDERYWAKHLLIIRLAPR